MNFEVVAPMVTVVLPSYQNIPVTETGSFSVVCYINMVYFQFRKVPLYGN